MTTPTALFAGPGAYRTLHPNLTGSDPFTPHRPLGGQTPLSSRGAFSLQMGTRGGENALLNVKGGLTPFGGGWVEVVVSGGAYLALGGDRLLVSGVGVPMGPVTLMVDRLEGLGLEVGMPVLVETEALVVGGQRVSTGRMRPWRGSRPGAVRGDPRPVAEAVLRRIAAPDTAIRKGLEALAAGDVRRGARLLAGLGRGLTPEGDDVLAGHAAWCHAAGARLRVSELVAGRASPIGLAYLRCAERGELFAPAAALLAAIRGGEHERALSLLPAVRALGASSGTALVWGIAAGAVSSTTVDEHSPS